MMNSPTNEPNTTEGNFVDDQGDMVVVGTLLIADEESSLPVLQAPLPVPETILEAEVVTTNTTITHGQQKGTSDRCRDITECCCLGVVGLICGGFLFIIFLTVVAVLFLGG